MSQLSPDYIEALCQLSPQTIAQHDPVQLRNALVVAIEQIEKDLVKVGVDFDAIRDGTKRSNLQKKVRQLAILDSCLKKVR
jgi:hypothetical protein